ncbi:hypothetical protein DID75_00240 [Candidatus Marinamargulisbacteria bacterium SCGC AG-410-N11]|nr:hypothetical protein DID75_00240 [Candidatus Marinamargulisbacteria bacterium SCGC AG-410-N11]
MNHLIIIILITFLFSTLNANTIMQYSNAFDADFFNHKISTVNNAKSQSESVFFLTILYADIEHIQTILTSLYTNILVKKHANYNQLCIKSPSQLKRDILKTVSMLDKPIKTIQLEFKIIEVTFDYSRNQPSVIDQFKTSSKLLRQSFTSFSQDEFERLLGPLCTMATVKIVATPMILAQHNQPASLSIGNQFPYITSHTNQTVTSTSFKQIQTGISIDITPTISTQNYIAIQLKSSIDNVNMWKDIGSSQYPVVANRSLNTSFNVANNESILIGSFQQHKQRDHHWMIETFSKVPFIGQYFKRRLRKTLMSYIYLYLKPTIAKGNIM